MNTWYMKDAGLPALDFSKPIVIVRQDVVLLLVAPTLREPRYQWLNLTNGRLNSSDGWETPQEAITSYSDGDKARNVNLDSIIRQNS